MPAVKAQNLVVQTVRIIPTKDNYWLVGNVAHPQTAPLRQPVRFRQDYDELLFVEQFAIESYLVDRWAEKTDVDFAPAQRIILEARKNITALNLNGGQALSELADGLTDCASQAGSDADFNDPRVAALRLARRFDRVAGLDHQFSRLLKEGMAGLGKFHMPLVAGEQFDSQVLLELPYLSAQRRLRNVQPLRRRAKI